MPRRRTPPRGPALASTVRTTALTCQQRMRLLCASVARVSTCDGEKNSARAASAPPPLSAQLRPPQRAQCLPHRASLGAPHLSSSPQSYSCASRGAPRVHWPAGGPHERTRSLPRAHRSSTTRHGVVQARRGLRQAHQRLCAQNEAPVRPRPLPPHPTTPDLRLPPPTPPSARSVRSARALLAPCAGRSTARCWPRSARSNSCASCWAFTSTRTTWRSSSTCARWACA